MSPAHPSSAPLLPQQTVAWKCPKTLYSVSPLAFSQAVASTWNVLCVPGNLLLPFPDSTLIQSGVWNLCWSPQQDGCPPLSPYTIDPILFYAEHMAVINRLTPPSLTSRWALKTLEGWKMCYSHLLSPQLPNTSAHGRCLANVDFSVTFKITLHVLPCISQSLNFKSPLNSFPPRHTTILHWLAPFRDEKTEVQKLVVIGPRSLSKKVAELSRARGVLVCSEPSGLQGRGVAISSRCQVRRCTEDTISIQTLGTPPSVPLLLWSSLWSELLGAPLRGGLREGMLQEVTWVGLGLADSSSNCGQVSKLRLQPGLQWEGEGWEFELLLLQSYPWHWFA